MIILARPCPTTHTGFANSWMLEKRMTRPDEGCTTHTWHALLWNENCKGTNQTKPGSSTETRADDPGSCQAHTNGQEMNAERACLILLGVGCSTSDDISFCCGSATNHKEPNVHVATRLDGPKECHAHTKGQELDGGVDWLRHPALSARKGAQVPTALVSATLPRHPWTA